MNNNKIGLNMHKPNKNKINNCKTIKNLNNLYKDKNILNV